MKSVVLPDRSTPVSAQPERPLREPSEGATPKKRSLAYLLFAVLAAAVVIAYELPRLFQPPPQNVVQASGRVEGREVSLAAKEIQGRVARLYADEGSVVKQGQLLAELESDQLEAHSAGLKANVSNLDAQIAQMDLDIAYTDKSTDAAISSAEAAVGLAEAHSVRAQAVLATSSADYERALGLARQGIIPQSSLDQASMSIQTSQADVDAAAKEILQAKANLAVAAAAKDTVTLKKQQMQSLKESRRTALAQVAETGANLAERRIVAPISGTILSRPVEVGDVVSAGSPLFVMVDMDRLYVKVYIPEPEIPKLKLGDPAEVAVDAFPGRTFPARITKIYDQAEFTPKNVETPEERVKLVFGVEVTLLNAGGLLKPGMPADCAIHWNAAGPGYER